MSVVFAGIAALLLLETLLPRPWRRWTWPVTAVLFAARHEVPAALLLGVAGALQWWPDRPNLEPVRWELARYWQDVALLGSAALSTLDAMEAAIPDTQWAALWEQVLEGFASGREERAMAFRAAYPIPEAHQLQVLVDHAWHAGLDVDVAFQEAAGMLERLNQERRTRAASAPLYSSLLPAALLLALMAMILVPVALSLIGGWTGL